MQTLIILAWRNIWRNKRRSFISIASVLFAVMFAIMADSFERGSYENMLKNLVNFSTGYIQVQDVLYEEEPSIDNILLYDEALTSTLEKFQEDIDFTVPRLQGFALAAGATKTRGAYILGIEPEKEKRLNDLESRITEGEFLTGKDERVVIGEGLAKVMNLSVGDTLILVGQGFQGVNAAGMFPVKGIVKLSIPDMNNNTVYMSIEAAQEFFGAEERISFLMVMPNNPSATRSLAHKINEELDSEWYRALTWEELLVDMLKMMEIDRAGSRMIIYILYVVIAFGLLGTILTMTLERLNEFKMLISIGMKRWQLAIIGLLESVFLSFIGVIAGMAITFPITLYYYLNPIELTGEMVQMMDEYGFEAVMPASIAPEIFISEALTIFFIALLIGLYPVVKIYRLKLQRD
jgi:putative ABC transport system permease protein